MNEFGNMKWQVYLVSTVFSTSFVISHVGSYTCLVSLFYQHLKFMFLTYFHSILSYLIHFLKEKFIRCLKSKRKLF